MRVLPVPLILMMLALCGCDLGTTPPHAADAMADLAPGDPAAVDSEAALEILLDTATGEEVGEPPPPPGDAPTAELLVKIVSPAAVGYAATPGSRVVVMGVAFGQVSGVQWTVTSTLQPTSPRGGTVATPSLTFWATDAIDLDPGDNFVVVTAHDDLGAVVSDRIVITYNQGFVLPARVVARPPTLFDGETQDLHASIAMGLFGGGSGVHVWLERVDQDGVQTDSTVWEMLDDGLVATSGDQIQGDGEFTRRVHLTCAPGHPFWLRAHVQGKGYDDKPLNVLSAPSRVDCLAHVTQTGVIQHRKTLANARKAYDDAIAQGMAAARTAAVAVLQADAAGAEVGGAADPGGLWIRWKDDVLGALSEPASDTRGGEGEAGASGLASLQSALTSTDTFNADVLGTRSALFLSPFAAELGTDDEVKAAAALAAADPCPPFVIDGPLQDDQATLDWFRAWGNYGLVALATHGEVYFKRLSAEAKAARFWVHPGSQEVLWTGEIVDVTRLAEQGHDCTQDAECASYGGHCVITTASFAGGKPSISGVCHDDTGADLVAGRVVLGDRTWGITPQFLLHYGTAGKGANGLVYLGACRTMWNGTLLAALYGAGARAVAGYSNVVTSKFAGRTGTDFLQRILGDKMSAGAAWGVGEQDPVHHGSFFKLFGDRQLSVPLDPLLNPGFETGDLTAWQKDGDGRVIARLGAAKPVSGKFMGIISTGLGFTLKVGTLTQPLCIPAGANRLTFWWKYFSEEFRANGGYCGAGYQDPFTASLVEADGTEHKMVAVKVDDFCGPKDKTCATKTPSECGRFWKVCQSDATRCGPFSDKCSLGEPAACDAFAKGANVACKQPCSGGQPAACQQCVTQLRQACVKCSAGDAIACKTCVPDVAAVCNPANCDPLDQPGCEACAAGNTAACNLCASGKWDACLKCVPEPLDSCKRCLPENRPACEACASGDPADCVDGPTDAAGTPLGLKPAFATGMANDTAQLAFDQGPNVFTIDWQRASYDVSALAGKGPLTLKLFNEDTGDTVFDTAILLDTFTLE